MTGTVLIFRTQGARTAEQVKVLIDSCADMGQLSVVGAPGRLPTTVIVEIAALPYEEAVQLASEQRPAQRPAAIVAADDFDITHLRQQIESGELTGILRAPNHAALWAYLGGN